MCWIKYLRFPVKDSEFSRVFSRVCKNRVLKTRHFLALSSVSRGKAHLHNARTSCPSCDVCLTLRIFEHDKTGKWASHDTERIFSMMAQQLCVWAETLPGLEGGMMNDAKRKRAPSAFITLVTVSAFTTKGGQVQARNCDCSVVWPFGWYHHPQ